MTSSDPGLQPERTELAWARTALSLVLAGVVGIRLLPLWVPVGGVAIAVTVIVAGVVFGTVSRLRSRTVASRIENGLPLPGAGALLALAAFASVAGATALVFSFVFPS